MMNKSTKQSDEMINASPSHRLTVSPIHRSMSAFAIFRWLGLIGVVSIAVMRCMVMFAPQTLFDVDPAGDSTPLGGLGPAGSLWLDAALLLACALAMLGEWRVRG